MSRATATLIQNKKEVPTEFNKIATRYDIATIKPGLPKRFADEC